MPETPPTIPQIVRALTTIDDRHTDALREQRRKHHDEMRTLKARYDGVDEALLSRDCLVDELKTVIATLCDRIERTQTQLKRDNQHCVYSEPLELMNLLGRNVDPVKLITQAQGKAREEKFKELARQKAASFKCFCGAHTKPFPSRHGGRGCQPTVACHCGKEWTGEMGTGHNLTECFRACRVCGHAEDRHTEELPEEGSANYCTECPGIGPFVPDNHTFDGAILAAWDRCKCGHQRSEHEGGICAVCHPDNGKSHEFALKLGVA